LSDFLLDTNVVSEARKRPGRADDGLSLWLASKAPDDLYLSVLVLGETRQGLERLRRTDPQGAARLDPWLDSLEQQYGRRILPVNEEIAQQWGRANARRRYPAVDGLMAATAVVHDLTLVTRNERDVEGSGARTLNPFSA